MAARLTVVQTLLILCMALSISATSRAEIIEPAPQPDDSTLSPGLGVTYYWGLNNFIYNLLQRMDHSAGTPGEPLPQLNYKSGHDTVLTSGKHDGVGAHIVGYIKLDAPGTYQFAIESNDGVRFALNEVVLIEDPDVHPDQWSNVAVAQISTPGWYPLEVLYFEKKNTATLRLVWKKPGTAEDDEMTPVPGEVFAHVAAQ